MMMSFPLGGCADVNWEPIDGPPLWCAIGQSFEHTASVRIPFPDGTTSWFDIDGVAEHFVDGTLSADRLTFAYSVAPPGSDGLVDRARYRCWVSIPDPDNPDTPKVWKWFVGEVRRKDL